MLLEIVKIAYEHPWYTAMLIICMAILVSEFHPVVVVKNYDLGLTKKKDEEKSCGFQFMHLEEVANDHNAKLSSNGDIDFHRI